MDDRERLFLVVMRGTSPASARSVLVTDDENVVQATVGAIQEHLHPGDSFDDAVRPGPRLHADDVHRERGAEVWIGGRHPAVGGKRVGRWRDRATVDEALRLIAPRDDPGAAEGINRRRVHLVAVDPFAGTYDKRGDQREWTADPGAIFEFIITVLETDALTPAEREHLEALTRELAPLPAIETEDRAAHEAWEAAWRVEQEARSQVGHQEHILGEIRREAVAARDRYDAAKRHGIGGVAANERRLTELREAAEEAESWLQSAKGEMERLEREHTAASRASSEALAEVQRRKAEVEGESDGG